MKTQKELILIFGLLLSMMPILYINSSNDLENKIQHVESEIKSRVKNIELIQSFIVDMPALHGAIEFQSYGQLDVVVKKLMEEEETVRDFFVLDDELNVLHSVHANYQEVSDSRKIFNEWNKQTPYIFSGNDVYSLMKTSDSQKRSYVVMRLSIGPFFNEKLSGDKRIDVSYKTSTDIVSKNKFEIQTEESKGTRVRYFFLYLKENLFSLILFGLGALLVFEVLMKLLINPFRKIVFFLQNLSSREIGDVRLDRFPRLFRPFIANIIDANEKIISANQKERDVEFQKFQFKVAQQVAHDIRSPLSVLKSLKNDLNPRSEESRRIFQISLNRIEEINLNLLKTNDHSSREAEKSSEELLSLLENVLIEKKAEFRNSSNVEIEGQFSHNSYGLHSEIRSSFLKRIISNIINNSVEACREKQCRVEVTLESTDGMNVIKITDNGPGIAEEFLKHVFEKGFTTKKSGNGLGLSGAKEELENIGGRIEIVSNEGQGVSVAVFIPRVKSTLSFTKSLDLFLYNKVIILDDDYSIHEIWEHKLKDKGCAIEHMYSSREILSKYERLEESTLLLSDFELINEKDDGINVINKLDHNRHSILVTARSEEIEIRERCGDVGIRFLSKTLIPYISIKSEAPIAVLIDDDNLTHWRWKTFCEKEKIVFKGYFSIDEFCQRDVNVEFEAIIFLDSDLGNNIKGEVEGEKISQLGFENIYLYTAYPEDSISRPSWIKGILPKEPEVAWNLFQEMNAKIVT